MSEQPGEPQPPASAPRRPPTENDPEKDSFTIRKAHVWLALRIAAAIVAIAFGWHVVSSTFFDHNSSNHQMTTDEIGAAVKESMQNQLSTDPRLSQYHLQVQKVDVVNKSGNQYQGMAVVRSAKGIDHNVQVEVTADQERMLWQAPPGSFAFAAFEQLETTPTPGQ